MLIGSSVELYVGLHSCLCFSHLEKLLLKAGSTPPRQLAIYRASYAFSYRNLTCTSIPGGSIEIGSVSSITSRWIDRDSVLDSDVLFLDTSSTPQLSTSIFSTPPRQIPRYLSIPASVEIYQLLYIRPLCDPKIIFFDLSLDISLFSLPKQSHLTPNLFLKDSSSFFKFLFTW